MGAFLVVIGCVFGLALGFVLPLRSFGHFAGFGAGVLCGLLISLMAGVLTASLLGGWCESLIGTTIGVPIGVSVGTFFGSAIMNGVAGLLGVLVLQWLRKLNRVP